MVSYCVVSGLVYLCNSSLNLIVSWREGERERERERRKYILIANSATFVPFVTGRRDANSN